MTDEAKLDIDSSGLVANVNKATASLDRADDAAKKLPKSLASLLTAMQLAERGFDSLAREGQSGLEKLQKEMAGSKGHLTKAMEDVVGGQLSFLKAGNVQMIDTVKAGNARLQGLYEQRLGFQGTLSDSELKLWKAHSVQLGGIQDAQLKKTSMVAILAVAGGEQVLAAQEALRAKELASVKSSADSLSATMATLRKKIAADSASTDKDTFTKIMGLGFGEADLVKAQKTLEDHVDKVGELRARLTNLEVSRGHGGLSYTKSSVEAELTKAEVRLEEHVVKVATMYEAIHAIENAPASPAKAGRAAELKSVEVKLAEHVANIGVLEKELAESSELREAIALENKKAANTAKLAIDRARLDQTAASYASEMTEIKSFYLAQAVEADKALVKKAEENTARLAINRARLDQTAASHASEMAEMKAFYTKQELESAAHIKANPASYISGPLKGMPMDVTAVARYQAEMDNLNKTVPEGVLAAKKLTDSHIKLKGVLSEGNAAMRGFTQGLGTMSAGMYSMLPFMASFLAGAAVMKTLKIGAEFQTSMFVIGELAGNSQESMVKLKDSVLALADTTQYGPLELAKGLETLTLAGLSATAAMQGLQPTLQFASATGMPVEKAAETLVAVQTAYKFTIDGFATIGDLIAKTAADTMSSGASMAEAFRTASVVAQQYKLTLEDTAVTLGMLANIGIQGGAAGTSYRNMITELNKGSGKAAEGIKALGAEVQNLDGSTRHIMDVMKDLSTGLITKTGAAQQRLLQDMTNERGAKAMAAFQSQMLTFLNTSNPQLQEQANALFKIGDVLGGNKLLTDAVTEAYDKMKTKMEESVNSAAAFTFFADLEKRLTASAQFAGIGASLEKAFVETFEKVGDSAYILGERIRGVFKSEEFNGALVSLAEGVLTLTKAFFDLGDWLASNSTALSIITVIFGTAAAIFLGPVGVVAGLTAGTVALQHLIDKFEVFNSVADKAAADEKKRLETSIKANELKVADSNKQIDTQIESQVKLLAKLRDKDKAEEEGIKIAGEAHMARIKQLYAQQREMVDLIRLQYILNEMQAKGKDANIVEIASSSAKMADTLKSGITKAEHDALDKAEVKMYQALYLAKQISAITKENAAKANTNPYGVDKKGGYTGNGKPAFVERLVLKQDNETETNLKFYNTELTSLANHEANKRKILEASRSNKLISEATFAGESLALTEKAEAAELALISAAQTKRAIDLGNDISKVRSQADAAMAKGAKEVEVTKTVNAAIADLGNKAATDMQTLQARADKARETADTRTKISRDKQIAGLKELDRESAKFWTDEAIRQAKASSSVALEDSLRYASPEAAARISAMATEQDYWNDKIREQEVAVKAAGKELLDYQATLVATENGTKDAVAEEEHYVAVLKKKAEALAKLKGYSVNAVDKAGENALIKLNKDNQQKLVQDVADAIETGLLQGGEAGKAKLRDILQAELMKPIRLMIQAFVNPVMGAVSGALGLNGMGSGGSGLLSGMSNVLGMGKTLSSVGSTLGNIGSSVAGFFGGGSALGGGLATAAAAPMTGLGMTLGSGLGVGTGTGLSLASGMSSGLGLTAGASTLGAGLGSSLAVGGGAAAGGGLASLGMLGPIGLGIGALALLSGMGGGFKSSGPTGDTQNVYSANGSLLDSKTWGGQSTLSNNTSNYMYEKYSALADTLGVGKVATNFRYGGNTGAQGENPNFAIGGGTGAFQYSQGETAVSDQNLALATSRAVFTALQGSVLPDYVARLLSTVDVSSASLDQLNAIATAAMEVKAKNQGLQDRLDLMTGKTTQLELDLRDTQDESTKSLIRQIYAQEALTKAAEETKAAWESLTNTLLDEIKRIRTNMVTGSTQTFAGAQTAFTLGTAQARAGDQKAIASLPGLSQALLKLAESNSVTSAEFMGWQAQTATSLEQTYGGLSVPSFDVGTNRVPQDMLAMVHKGEAIIPAAYNPANGGSGDEQVASLLREVIARLDSLDYGTRAIATHTSKSAKILDRVTPTGNSIQTTAVTP